MPHSKPLFPIAISHAVALRSRQKGHKNCRVDAALLLSDPYVIYLTSSPSFDAASCPPRAGRPRWASPCSPCPPSDQILQLRHVYAPDTWCAEVHPLNSCWAIKLLRTPGGACCAGPYYVGLWSTVNISRKCGRNKTKNSQLIRSNRRSAITALPI